MSIIQIAFLKKSLPTTNRFCLCAIDVGCGPAPAPVAEDLEFNILVLTSIVNKRNRERRTVSLFGPRGKPSPLPASQNRRCEWPLFTISTPWKTRDDNNAICVEGPCCKKDEANNPRTVGSGTAECPMSILSACEYLLEEVH